MEVYITVTEASKRTGVGQSTIYRYINHGMHFVTVGRNRFVKEPDVIKMKNQSQMTMLSGKGIRYE